MPAEFHDVLHYDIDIYINVTPHSQSRTLRSHSPRKRADRYSLIYHLLKLSILAHSPLGSVTIFTCDYAPNITPLTFSVYQTFDKMQYIFFALNSPLSTNPSNWPGFRCCASNYQHFRFIFWCKFWKEKEDNLNLKKSLVVRGIFFDSTSSFKFDGHKIFIIIRATIFVTYVGLRTILLLHWLEIFYWWFENWPIISKL